MKVRFRGVRGSVPVPGPACARYGGNTACLQVTGENGECLVLDAGTGLRELGVELLKQGPPPPIHLFLSHTHWDHIQGFPFFAPCYVPGAKIHVRGPVHFSDGRQLREVFDLQMRYEFFPISNRQLAADVKYESIGETETSVGGIGVRSRFVNHTIRTLGYRLTENGRALVYTGDHEPYYNLFAGEKAAGAAGDDEADDDDLFGDADAAVEEAEARFVEFLRGADLLVVDAQYTPEEYRASRRDWGHSSWDYCLEWMKRAGADRLVLTHHDPQRTDEELEAVSAEVRRAAADKGLDPQKIFTAREGDEYVV